MPNFSGIWTVTQQMQARGASTWPSTPGAPTIGTATAGSSSCASVAFTAPACAGYPATITGYRVISTPGCFTNTGASSPVVVSGLSSGTSYTFKAQATNAIGYGDLSAASNSITAATAGQQAYTTAGTYSWVAPAGVTSVSVVAVGGGGGGAAGANVCIPQGYFGGYGGGGGGLGYLNNYSVTPGSSYTVVVGAGGSATNPNGNAGCNSYFVSTAVVRGGGGGGGGGYGNCGNRTAGTAGTYTGTGGGNGGPGVTSGYSNGGCGTGGGGAGGYSGNGGAGLGDCSCIPNNAGSGGSASGGAARSVCVRYGGGGVGLLGQGSSGIAANGTNGFYGHGGSSGADASNATGALYGGGGSGGGSYARSNGGNGGRGAVRIIWPGTSRSFPSTNTGNL